MMDLQLWASSVRGCGSVEVADLDGVESSAVTELLRGRRALNRNGVDDTADIAADPVLDIWPRDGRIDDCNQCDGDYNRDGNVDQEDISCFTGLVGGDVTSDCYQGLVNYLAGLGLTDPASHVSALLDVNNDGNVDQDDVSALINIVGGGGCP
jgi:hypothetical protein